jgi:hypothetical protein
MQHVNALIEHTTEINEPSPGDSVFNDIESLIEYFGTLSDSSEHMQIKMILCERMYTKYNDQMKRGQFVSKLWPSKMDYNDYMFFQVCEWVADLLHVLQLVYDKQSYINLPFDQCASIAIAYGKLSSGEKSEFMEALKNTLDRKNNPPPTPPSTPEPQKQPGDNKRKRDPGYFNFDCLVQMTKKRKLLGNVDFQLNESDDKATVNTLDVLQNMPIQKRHAISTNVHHRGVGTLLMGGFENVGKSTWVKTELGDVAPTGNGTVTKSPVHYHRMKPTQAHPHGSYTVNNEPVTNVSVKLAEISRGRDYSVDCINVHIYKNEYKEYMRVIIDLPGIVDFRQSTPKDKILYQIYQKYYKSDDYSFKVFAMFSKDIKQDIGNINDIYKILAPHQILLTRYDCLVVFFNDHEETMTHFVNKIPDTIPIVCIQCPKKDVTNFDDEIKNIDRAMRSHNHPKLGAHIFHQNAKYYYNHVQETIRRVLMNNTRNVIHRRKKDLERVFELSRLNPSQRATIAIQNQPLSIDEKNELHKLPMIAKYKFSSVTHRQRIINSLMQGSIESPCTSDEQIIHQLTKYSMECNRRPITEYFIHLTNFFQSRFQEDEVGIRDQYVRTVERMFNELEKFTLKYLDMEMQHTDNNEIRNIALERPVQNKIDELFEKSRRLSMIKMRRVQNIMLASVKSFVSQYEQQFITDCTSVELSQNIEKKIQALKDDLDYFRNLLKNQL